MTITLENKHLVLGAASLIATFQLYRTFSTIFANTKPTKHTNGFSVQVERGLGSLDPDSELGKGANEVYPPDAFEGGSDVRLPNGRVKYYLLGPEEGEKIVLVHGFSSPCLVWRELGTSLANAGFRVLMYDHYGRGYSDHPIVPYNGPLYTTTLALLMNHVGFEKAHICGYSMGAPITISFADIFPHMVSKIILLAPAGLMDPTPFRLTRQIDPTSFIEAPSWLKKIMRPSGPVNYDANSMPENVKMLAKLGEIQSQRPPFVHALLSTLREGILFDQDEIYKAIGRRRSNPIHIIWGTDDKIVPYSLSERMLEYLPSANLDTIEGAGHDLVISSAEHVQKSIIDFLNERNERE